MRYEIYVSGHHHFGHDNAVSASRDARQLAETMQSRVIVRDSQDGTEWTYEPQEGDGYDWYREGVSGMAALPHPAPNGNPQCHGNGQHCHYRAGN